jgi:hypothetical protein
MRLFPHPTIIEPISQYDRACPMDVARDISARIEGLRPYLIHGERYVVVYYSVDEDKDTVHQAQLSADALPDGLRVGESVVVHAVMGVVAGVTRRRPE